MAGWAAQVSTAARERSNTLMPHSVSCRFRRRYRVSPPLAWDFLRGGHRLLGFVQVAMLKLVNDE